MELSDLSICKRIAEIEWFSDTKHKWSMEVENEKITILNGNGCEIFEDYNPLTDDALCLRLIDKYNVVINVHFQCPNVKQAYVMYEKDFKIVTTKVFSINDLGINKASLLSIIESRKEQ